METKLQPCPFCGGEAKLYGGRPDNYAWIRCTKCHATLDSRIGEKHAADTWNTRTPADRDVLADELIAWAADEGNIVASGEYEYEEYCVLCNQQVQLGPHAPDCLHLRARAMLEAQ